MAVNGLREGWSRMLEMSGLVFFISCSILDRKISPGHRVLPYWFEPHLPDPVMRGN
jgi:hypothetical protein